MVFRGPGYRLVVKGTVGCCIDRYPPGAMGCYFQAAVTTVKKLPWLLGSLLTLAIAVPWYVLAELKTPGFLNYFIIGEHFSRFLDPGWAGDLYGSAHDRPKGMIWIFWIWASFPWGIIGLVGFGLAAARGKTKDIFTGAVQDASTLYLLFCAITPMLFFTLAGNTLWTYILPSLPFSAILIAGWVSQLNLRPWSRIRSGAVLLAPVLFTLSVFIGVSGVKPLKTEKQLIGRYESIQQAGDGPIFYIGKMPFSARFYSLGDAVEITSTEFDSLLDADGYARVFAAIPNDAVDKVLGPRATDAQKLGENKRYQLFSIDLPPTDSQNDPVDSELNSKND